MPQPKKTSVISIPKGIRNDEVMNSSVSKSLLPNMLGSDISSFAHKITKKPRIKTPKLNKYEAFA